MSRLQRLRWLALGAVVALLAAACGGGDDATDTTGATATTTAATGTTQPTSTTAAAGIGGYQDVQPAVIQIVSQGTFRDPEVGYAYSSGAGSGFILSPDGLAVTNNHVVAGAATLEVFVGGDTSNSYNATILGVSECNDLALIDIAESEPLPYLEWFDGEVTAGLDVYAAGFPLGDPEFTLTRGIVAKARAAGDITGTSSIDHTFEHDANIQPGNSGGPLVSTEGTVVGVNYAGGAVATTTAQFFAIAHDLASPVVEQMENGDVESIGINGWAVFDEALGVSGIWVAGVSAGSPAAEADILPGDIITSLNGLPMGTDGTFKDYCDVLRTAGPGQPMAVEVLRWDTSEVLAGEINGDEPLALTVSLAEEVEEDVDTEASGPATYSEYESVTDDTGTITVSVPVEWSERDTVPAEIDGEEIPYIAAATSLDGFLNGYTDPGLLYIALDPSNDVDGTLAENAFGTDCEDGGISDYEDPVFTGKYQLWVECADGSADLLVLAAQPADGSVTVLLMVQMVTDADLDALDQAIASFNLVG